MPRSRVAVAGLSPPISHAPVARWNRRQIFVACRPSWRGSGVTLSTMLIALAAMFTQQTFASVAKTLPAVVAPLVIVELHADPAWVGVYYGLSAAAALLAQMGCGSFVIRYGALRMSQAALVLLGGGMAAAGGGGPLGFGASAVLCGGWGGVFSPADYTPACRH